MKGLGLCLVFLSCCGLGFQMVWGMTGCLYLCGKIRQAIGRLSGEIRFARLPLTEAMKVTAGREDGPFSTRLDRAAKQMEQGDRGSFDRIWQESMGGLERQLTEEGTELLLGLGQELGQLDLEAQIEALRVFLLRWDQMMEQLRREKDKNQRLYGGLGICGGIFLVILLW